MIGRLYTENAKMLK